VSLCPSITESLVAIGLRDELVGVTRYCIHPAAELRGVPRVGGTKNPDLARIGALSPDLVFVNAEENRREDVEALRERFDVDVSHPCSAEEVPALLRHFGRRTARESQAEGWAARIEARLAELSPAERRPFRFAYLIWKAPWMAAAGGTYISNLLAVVGGHNVLDGGDPYPTVAEEALAAADPDLLLLPDEPYRFREPDCAFWQERLPRAAVRLVSGDDLCWHGVRTLRGLDAVEGLARDLAP